MNWVKQMRGFYAILTEREVDIKANALYCTLLMIANSMFWPPVLVIPDKKMMSILGISRNTLRAARVELRMLGLVDCKSEGPTGRGMIYRIRELGDADGDNEKVSGCRNTHGTPANEGKNSPSD